MLDERQRMAREIHDTIAQGLAGIITQLEAAGQAAASEPQWRRHHDNAMSLARESLAEARRSVRAVRPEQLAQARLPEAMAGSANAGRTSTAVPVELTTTGTVRPMHPEVEVTLLRTAQEALANVGKHAGRDRVGLTLSYMEDLITLDVRDDGVGFDARPRDRRRTASGSSRCASGWTGWPGSWRSSRRPGRAPRSARACPPWTSDAELVTAR